MNWSNHMETQLNSTRLNSTEMNTYLNAALNMIESNSYPVTKSIESWGRWIDSTTGTSDEIQRPTLWQPLHREPETAPKKKYKNSPTKEPLRVFSSRAARGHLPCIFFPLAKPPLLFFYACVCVCVCVCVQRRHFLGLFAHILFRISSEVTHWYCRWSSAPSFDSLGSLHSLNISKIGLFRSSRFAPSVSDNFNATTW